MSLVSLMTRILFKRSDKKRDAGLTTPDYVKRFDNIQYGPDKKWNRLDVYRPKDIDGKLPVIVSVHGGGWVYGDKELYQYYCISLVQHGFAVVNFTYRLAPKFKYPAQLEDTNNAFRWVLEHGEEYGLDTGNVFGVGDSAGGQLLGVYACMCTDREYAATLPFSVPEGFVPRAVALNCGVYKLENSGDKNVSNMLMKDLLPGKGTDAELLNLSVMDHVTGSFPPAFIMTAEGDFLAPQAKPLADKLNGLGGYAEYHYYGDADHKLGHVFHCNMKLAEAAQCNRDECEFFRKYIV